VILVESKI